MRGGNDHCDLHCAQRRRAVIAQPRGLCSLRGRRAHRRCGRGRSRLARRHPRGRRGGRLRDRREMRDQWRGLAACRQARPEGLAPRARSRGYAGHGRREELARPHRTKREGAAYARLPRPSAERRSMAASAIWLGLRSVRLRAADAIRLLVPRRDANFLPNAKAAGEGREPARKSKGRRGRACVFEAISRPCAANARRAAA